MLYIFLALCFLLFYINRNLLLILILLEILGFVVIYYISLTYGHSISSDYLVLLAFSILVIEGVIALCGLIMLVSFSGSDYLTSSSFLNL